ncbi:hypothetical protein KIJ96_09935 [Pseudoalteromonas piscicida]|uniref:hypothetical protein n=1 Tax=Pseudoalteromonas piscicida TaxID=43662 RepID=UPI001D0A6258|nr:hypothetical protein [Pseudoalteromonas piscicida]UDM60183.1 hypothetical protein KIJ96_09935 [Pseudoalteromonas piscicida]
MEKQESKSIELDEIIKQLEQANKVERKKKIEVTGFVFLYLALSVFLNYFPYMYKSVLFGYTAITVMYLLLKQHQQQTSINLIISALKEIK